MAAPTMSRSETFGHYLLPLTMNKGHINAKDAGYHIEVKTKYLDLKQHRPERHALRNFLGMLHFRLGNYEESLAYFDKILSDGEDPENLNALANRKYICDKLYRFPEARVCEEKISELLPDDYQAEEEKSQLRRARGLAEQAFAYSFDVFGESVTNERYRTSVNLYDEAFELAGDSLTQDEREDWMTSKGMACHKIFGAVKWDKSLKEEAKTWLEKTVDIFIQIVEKTNDNSLKSESWRQLGEIFREVKLAPYFIPVPDKYKKYIHQQQECFQKALDLSPEDSRILARLANYYKKRHNEKEALKYVDKSIALDKTAYNSFAFSIRGQIFQQIYDNHQTPLTKGKRSNRPDDNLLMKAQNDFEKASEIHSTPINLEELALVYYYVATDCHGNVKEECDRQTYLQKALTACAKAAACQDGEKRPLVHKVRGQSLCALGEHQHALRSFQRAMECKYIKPVIFESGDLLIGEYVHILEGMSDELSGHPTLLADMVYWLHKAAKLRLENFGWKTYSMATLVKLTSHWQSFVKFCEEKDYLTELEDIQAASLDPRERRSPQRRTVSTSDLEPRSAPSTLRHSKSVTEEASRAGSKYHVPHARKGSAKASSSAAELDDDEAPSDAEITSEITSLQLGDQTSSSQEEWTSNDASNKPIRSAPERALNSDLPNDFFVLYSSSASEWVFRCLLEELEGSDLKGCIKDRDFMLGKSNMDNLTESIENSACVIVVRTKDSASDKWCKLGTEMSFEQKKLLIPVLREDSLPPSYLDAITSLDATGPVNWERLRRSIEQQIPLGVV